LAIAKSIFDDYIDDLFKGKNTGLQKRISGFEFYQDSDGDLELAKLESLPVFNPKTKEIDIDAEPDESEGFYDGSYLSEIASGGDGLRDTYVAENPTEQKGRIVAPFYGLDDFPELLLGDNDRVGGLDVAEFGDDRTALAVRIGIHIVDIQSYSKIDEMKIVGYALQAIKEWDLKELVIDTTGGYGAGVVARLGEVGIGKVCRITPVKYNAKPRDPYTYRPKNARTEMWFLGMQRLLDGRLTLPNDAEAVEDILAVRYDVKSDGGEIMLVPKKKTKELTRRSPDKGDAVMLTLYTMPPLKVY
jgi:hypothetical protein